MLRLELNAEDLAKLRISPPWGPFSEALFSLMQLQAGQPNGLVDGWRQRVREHAGPWATPLVTLIRPDMFVDLHTVVGRASSLDEALDSFLAAPDAHLRMELRELLPVVTAADTVTPPWMRSWLTDLAAGDRRARHDLAERFDRYSQLAIAPYWPAIRTQLEAERAYRARALADGGIDLLLSTLHPRIRWRPPVLEVDNGRPSSKREPSKLDGRSLLLIPSAFSIGGPHVLHSMADEAAPDMLFYPAVRDAESALAVWAGHGHQRRSALGLLVGRTRAAALEAIADVCSTTELAHRIGVTPATASHHASVLRDTGLITTRRNGGAVIHCITQLGARLLDGDHRSTG